MIRNTIKRQQQNFVEPFVKIKIKEKELSRPKIGLHKN